MENTIKYSYYKRRSQTTRSAEKVASNDDLLTEILRRLPINSLSLFKFVSKRWFSLITSPGFYLLLPDPMKPSGLFLKRPSSSFCEPLYEYIPFNYNETPSKPPFRTLSFIPDYYGIHILQSCNGFLFCCISERDRKYYVYNPTTKQCTTLPPLPGKICRIYTMVLAFDPLMLPHFKVICVRQFSRKLMQIVIYSAQTKSWKVCGQPFIRDIRKDFRRGVYLNGMIHWTSCGSSDSTYYFKIDEERLETMPMPPRPTSSFGSQTCCGPSYFGASRGHLHHVETYGPHCTVFDVYEMEKDYSGWFLKYHVDLSESPNFRTYADPVRQKYRFRIQMLSIIRGQREEDSFLVLEIPSKILEYNLVEKTSKQLNEFTPGHEYRDWDSAAFEFIESLY